MYKAAFNRFLFSILLLVFTACGGGGSDSGAGAGSGGEINHAGLTSESRFIAITTPPWTTFPISVSKNSEGKEVLTVVKKTRRLMSPSPPHSTNLRVKSSYYPFDSIISACLTIG